MSMIAVRALLFDTLGTLVDWRGGLIVHLETWGAARGISADWEGLVDTWRGAYVPSMARVRAGERDWAGLEDLPRESLKALAPQFRVSRSQGGALEELLHLWQQVPPWPD